MTMHSVVFIVDDNREFAESLSALIGSTGLHTQCFNSAAEFLQQYDPKQPGCLILDVRMPNTSGLALQAHLSKLPYHPPVVIMTGHAEVPTALRAMRQGAIDFLQKTFTEEELFDAVYRALDADCKNRATFERHAQLTSRFSRLTVPERDVLAHVLRGTANKAIAADLKISRRTVEDRRARLMHKLEVESVAELVRMAIEAGFSTESMLSHQ
jgi:FixJ family two-component response regulator